MKYRPTIYAKAFAGAKEKASKREENQLIKNFVALIRRNGDIAHFPAILEKTESILRERSGRTKIIVETARPIANKVKKSLGKALAQFDDIEEQIVPELLAGVRLTTSDGRRLDKTLKRKIEKMFL